MLNAKSSLISELKVKVDHLVSAAVLSSMKFIRVPRM